MGGSMEDYKPAIILIACQFLYSGVTLISRAALLQDMSSMVFVVYRQFTAFLLIVPVVYFARKGKRSCYMGWKNFWLIFLLSFVGVTVNQTSYFEGLYLASSSVASALFNLVPAITFIIAYTMGLEKINLRSLRSVAKIIGTILCVTGAVAMALLKGPKLLNMEFVPTNPLFHQSGNDTWLFGCFLLFLSSSCWSLWLILQVRVSATYPDHLSLTAWMCLLASLQSGILTLIVDQGDMQVWKVNSSLELICYLYAGLASAVTFFAQAWCISKRGPLFSAMFSPLSTIIITVYACVFMREELYTGSLVGSLAVIVGLYAVLWGKAKDFDQDMKIQTSTDLEDPLLPETTTSFGDEITRNQQ